MIVFRLIWLIAFGFVLGDLPPPERSYNILMLYPIGSKSHRNVFMPIAEALADRGHKVVILSSFNQTSKHANIKEIPHGLKSFFTDDLNMFEVGKNMQSMMGSILDYMLDMTRNIYKVPQVKELYEKRKEFDVIFIMHAVNEMMIPFLQEIPFIIVVPVGIDPILSAVVGNPLNPSYVNNLMKRVNLSSTFGRFLNLVLHTLPATYWRKWMAFPPIEKELLSQFPGLPSITEVERNVSLTLLNTHFSMDAVLPFLPSQIEVGAMHCRTGKSLPEDLKSWIEGAGSLGVVYFSLGSITRGDTMPLIYRNMFLETFGKLKQRVIWKYEGNLENVPRNVMISKWLPQQDVLAHPSVKVFISHGGGLSTQESSFHGVPMLILPVYGDQYKNAEHIEETERGLHLSWEELSEQKLFDALQKLLTDSKYGENMAKVSRYYKDQPQSAKDRAVFWSEYVIRHRGATHLRTPAAELSWIEFLMLDVLAILIIILVIVLKLISMVARKLKKLLLRIVGIKQKRA